VRRVGKMDEQTKKVHNKKKATAETERLKRRKAGDDRDLRKRAGGFFLRWVQFYHHSFQLPRKTKLMSFRS
jgi:hypothetical protein